MFENDKLLRRLTITALTLISIYLLGRMDYFYIPLGRILTIIIFLMLLKVPRFIIESLASKSVTTPIAIGITKLTGGIPEITAGIVIAVGIFGNAFGPFILKKLGIKSKIAIGTALGTAAHGIGTARAFEESKLAGVYSGLAMCVNGIITALLTPYLLLLFMGSHA